MQYILRTIFLSIILFTGVFAQLENFTYLLTQSENPFDFWTTPPTEKVFKNSNIPVETASTLKLYMARNEFEPLQFVVKSAASENIILTLSDFGSGITTELFQVKYVHIETASDHLGRTGDNPDPLWPIENGASIDLVSGENTPFWINIFVPKETPPGDYSATISINDYFTIPIELHVFNFELPDTLHVHSQFPINFNNIMSKYDVPLGNNDDYWMYVNRTKQFMKDHRLTPAAVSWPGGLTSSGGDPNPNLVYDCAGNITDPYGQWGFEALSQLYLDGDTLRNHVGFPSFPAIYLSGNDPSSDPRPAIFCNHSRSGADWYTGDNPTSAYNQSWFQYMTALQNYLGELGYLEKAIHFMASEPQDQEDYVAIAWYSRYLKQAAPFLKLMVAEEPKEDIFGLEYYIADSQIDIWLTLLNNYNPETAFDRELNHDEISWLYFLHGTRPPYFNPHTIDHPGIHSKLTGWFMWKYRLRGWYHYAFNSWQQNPWTDPETFSHNGEAFLIYPPSMDNTNITFGSNNHRMVPSIRLELIRDGLEDFEYLYLLNEDHLPQVGLDNEADVQAHKIISGLTSYNRNSQFIYNLRKVIGQKLGGEIAEIPDIYPPSEHPRSEGEPGNYYINFQDPDGEPTETPLIVNDHEYMKIGWELYRPENGFGWYGDSSAVGYTYITYGPNELQKSILYDTYGRIHTFEFDLPVGTYNVTVSAGWSGTGTDHQYVNVEGIPVINDEHTGGSDPYYLVHTEQVTILDKKLTLQMSVYGEFTFLNYMDIEAVSTAIDPEPTTGLLNDFKLYQNYPNPFNPATVIRYQLPVNSKVEITIFNALGQKVETLVHQKQPADLYKVEWHAGGMPSGIYFYRIKAGDHFSKTRKMVLMK